MPVNNNNFEIENVELADTFEFWRTKTNDAIIAKLNYLKLYDLGISSATGGGITANVATSLGKLNIALNDVIQKGVTFTEDVGFCGGVLISSDILNLNRDDEGSVLMGSTCGLVLGPSTGGYTADGGWLEAGQSFSINGFTGPYWLNNSGYWFTEQDLRFDRQEGTKIQFGSTGTNNHLVFCGPGQGYTTDPGVTAQTTESRGLNANTIRIYNMATRGTNVLGGAGGSRYHGTNKNQVAEILDDGTVHFTSGVNKKRIEQSSHGLTFGHVVRFDGTNYLKSFAGATGGDGTTYESYFSESVGIVSDVLGATGGGNTFDITFSGEVRGDFSDVVVGSSELTPGCIYYLSTTGEGMITNTQPSGTGLTYDKVVSKPVLYALGATSGLMLTYRGQEITPDSATIAYYGATGGALGTADIYHTSRISITNNQGFTSGNVISFYTDSAGSGYTLASRLNDALDSTKAVDTARSVIGIVGVENTSANTVTVISSGLITGNDNISFAGMNTGHHVLGTTYGGLSADNDQFNYPGGWYKPICTILDANNAVVHIGGVQTVRPVDGGGTTNTAASNWGGSRSTTTHLINGSFYYWRRGIGIDSVTPYGKTADTYFADRWKRTSGASATAVGATHDFSIQRKTFNDVQDDVPGSPKYYAEVKGTYATGGVGSTHGYFHRVEQRMEDSNSLSNRLMSLSLYYKSDQSYAAGASVGVSFLKSVDGSSETKKDIGEFLPTSSWQRYSTTFITPEGKTATNSNSYNAIALYTTDMSRYGAGHTGQPGKLSIAQVKLEEGNGTTSYPEVDPQEELRRCERYYHNSYPVDKYPGNNTMINTQHTKSNAIQFMVPQNGRHVHKFSESMRITPTSLAIWSPTGLTGNAFNVTAKRDLTKTAGTSGLLGGRRTSMSGNPALITADVPTAADIHIVAGFAALDIIAFHYEADSEL